MAQFASLETCFSYREKCHGEHLNETIKCIELLLQKKTNIMNFQKLFHFCIVVYPKHFRLNSYAEEIIVKVLYSNSIQETINVGISFQ